ncbi:MAG: ribonuclease P protein component [Saprospiraceae bacterium]
MKSFTLSKQERLSSLKEIEVLFKEGKSFTKYPFRVIWLDKNPTSGSGIRVMFSVSKRKFTRAVDRNKVKRLMRESYRLLKPTFYQSMPENASWDIGFVYTGKEILDFQTIQQNLLKALDRLSTQHRPEIK